MSALRFGQSNFGLSISKHSAPAFTCFSLGSLFVRPATGGWFVGKDVAEALGYKEAAKAVRERVDAEDKGVAKCDTLGGRQEILFINESGLYSLILSSKLPGAKEFKRWVTSEVIPSIRYPDSGDWGNDS